MKMKLMKKIILLMAGALMVLSSCGKDPAPKPDDGNDPSGGGEQPVTPSPDAYEIGDFYKSGLTKGIVIYVDESGEHGLAVSLKESVEQWSIVAEQPMNSAPNEDGMLNMQSVQRMDNWQSNYPAFAWCYSLNVNGLEKWYLPSYTELDRLYRAYTGVGLSTGSDIEPDAVKSSEMTREEHKAWFNKCLTDNGGAAMCDGLYWTSDEMGSTAAYAIDFMTGNYPYINEMDKAKLHNVRAICKF